MTKMHSEQTLRPTGSQKSSNLSSVSEDRNFSLGGEVVGILVLALGVAMGTDLAWCRIGTSEPVFSKDQFCSLGRIAGRVPMS